MKEANLQRSILKYLKGNGYAVKVVVANKNGVPDIICCIDGKFVAFEVKSDKRTVTVLQERNLQEIERNGGIACVVRSLNEVVEVVGKIKTKTRGCKCDFSHNY